MTAVTLLLLTGTNPVQAQIQAQATEQGQQPSPHEAPHTERSDTAKPEASSYRPSHPVRLWLGVFNAGLSYDLPARSSLNAVVSVYGEAAIWFAPSSVGLTARFPRRHSGAYLQPGIGLLIDGYGLLGFRLLGGWQTRGSMFFEVGIMTVPTAKDSGWRDNGYTGVLVRLGWRL
jgi:hypothetical protein